MAPKQSQETLKDLTPHAEQVKGGKPKKNETLNSSVTKKLNDTATGIIGKI